MMNKEEIPFESEPIEWCTCEIPSEFMSIDGACTKCGFLLTEEIFEERLRWIKTNQELILVKEKMEKYKKALSYYTDHDNLARGFHYYYETYAKEFDWKTQNTCQVKFNELPKENRSLMLKVSYEIGKIARKALEEKDAR